jgi:hypothetical protein
MMMLGFYQQHWDDVFARLVFAPLAGMLQVRTKHVALNNPVYWLKLLQWTTTSGTTARRKTAY